MAHKIYLSASTQEKNVGVGVYGTEEYRMFILRDLTEQLIKNGGHGDKFIIKKNVNKLSELSDIIRASNAFGADSHWAFHTNAGDKTARGCESYYHKVKAEGYKMAQAWYDEVKKITPTEDRGVHPDTILYNNGLYELRETTAHAALMEFIFHTNVDDVVFFLANIGKFAEATAKAIYKYYGLTYKTEVKQSAYTGIMLEAYNKGWITKEGYDPNEKVTLEKVMYILKNFEKYLDNK